MAKKRYEFLVQRDSDEYVLLRHEMETAKPAGVEVQRLPDGTVRLLEEGKSVAVGWGVVNAREPLSLVRRDVQSSKVVTKPV
jgi:hypothetical protein